MNSSQEITIRAESVNLITRVFRIKRFDPPEFMNVRLSRQVGEIVARAYCQHTVIGIVYGLSRAAAIERISRNQLIESLFDVERDLIVEGMGDIQFFVTYAEAVYVMHWCLGHLNGVEVLSTCPDTVANCFAQIDIERVGNNGLNVNLRSDDEVCRAFDLYYCASRVIINDQSRAHRRLLPVILHRLRALVWLCGLNTRDFFTPA